MIITTGGVLLIIVGVLVVVGSLLLAIFAGPFVWWQIVLLVALALTGFGAVMGGSEIKR